MTFVKHYINLLVVKIYDLDRVAEIQLILLEAAAIWFAIRHASFLFLRR